MPAVTNTFEKTILRHVLQHGPLSRARLGVLSGLRKMTVYETADELVRRRLLDEEQARRLPRGRPERPLGIARDRHPVVGVLIERSRIEVTRVNLLAEPCNAATIVRRPRSRDAIAGTVNELIERVRDDTTVAIGIASTGFLDRQTGSVLLDASSRRERAGVSLAGVVASAGVPVILQNDLHAMAARWVLTERRCVEPEEDLLMVHLGDGQLGAAMLIGGRPNHGCVGGANELGHMRLAVETEPCYCGSRSGCAERVFSSSFLARRTPGRDSKANLLRAMERAPATPELDQLVDLTGMAIANAVNLTRAGRLLLSGPGVRADAAFERLMVAVRRHTLGTIDSRLRIERWTATDTLSARSAACLAIAHLLLEGWLPLA
jgi:predicted NBD/HSP70 family sugar kinase